MVYKLVADAARQGQARPTPSGTYLVWRDKTGAEIWVQRDPEGNIVGFNPHFSGKSTMSIGLQRRITRINSSILDGAFYGWASPDDEHAEGGYYPFVFDAPDFVVYQAITLPTIVRVQLSAFAHQLDAYPSEDAYSATQKKPGLAAEAFIPSGLFSAKMEPKDPPEAEAIFTGRVLERASLTNSLTGERYEWLRVRTFGGEIDVVADPHVVRGNVVQEGIVSGSFWLTGRIVGHGPPSQQV